MIPRASVAMMEKFGLLSTPGGTAATLAHASCGNDSPATSRSSLCGSGECDRRQWQADHELAPSPFAVADGEHAALVRRHQFLHDRQADAQAAGGHALDMLVLHVQLEDVRQRLAGDAGAVVLDRDCHLPALHGHLDGDLATGQRVLASVPYEV